MVFQVNIYLISGVYNHDLGDEPKCLGIDLQKTKGSDFEEYKNTSK